MATGPPLLAALAMLEDSFEDLSEKKRLFIKELAMHLPHADPYVQSADGIFVDIFWEDQLSLTLNEDDAVCIGYKTDAGFETIYFDDLLAPGTMHWIVARQAWVRQKLTRS
jgi:hypothetical protein